MRTEELDFYYPESLVATEPSANFRVLLVGREIQEIQKSQIFDQFKAGDGLVINDTGVEKRRVFANDPEELEILFAKPLSEKRWEVLFPAKQVELDQKIFLPGDVTMTLIRKGLPQVVELDRPLPEDYFAKQGEMALPPYIQKARNQRHQTSDDQKWYQTAWAQHPGSCAAPTASLHFNNDDLKTLRERGVIIIPLTLHVGLGTFMPVKTAQLDQHQMHAEYISIPRSSQEQIHQIKEKGGRIWALGTTACRSLEAWAQGHLKTQNNGDAVGESDLFITPGHEWKVVDVLLTNFHQPRSTLLALVMAFAGRERVIKAYGDAVEKRFRLFSYGDLSVWEKQPVERS